MKGLYLLGLLLWWLLPQAAAAQTPAVAENARARVDAAGGTVSLGRVRLVVPPDSVQNPTFVALAINALPDPRTGDPSASRVSVLVSVSPPPRAPLRLEFMGAMVATTAQPITQMSIRNALTDLENPCIIADSVIACEVSRSGVYRLTVGSNSGRSEMQSFVRPNRSADSRIALAVSLGFVVALLSLALVYRIPSLRGRQNQ